jgi:hypothetical protein
MTNEWNEYKAYIGQPTYAVSNGKDTSFLGRFTTEMIKDFKGFARIFTIIARGYLFHNADGSLKDGDPRKRIEYARRALCAWCSMPDKKKNATPNAEWQFKVSFPEYHEEFPELVNEDGAGWYYRHIHALAEFIRNNTGSVNKRLHCLAERTKEWDAAWENKVKQYQVPLFSSNTNAEWLLSFDSAIADALELGALRCEAVTLTAEQTKRLEQFKPKDVPLKVLTTLAEYYVANKQEQSEWVILPVTNIGAYLGSSSLGRQYLSKIPPELMERKQSSFGASVYRMWL